MAVPLRTSIPKKLGTIVVVYGILIPFLPLYVSAWISDVSLLEVGACLFSDRCSPTALFESGHWIPFPIVFYFLTAVFSLLVAQIVNWSLPTNKKSQPLRNRLKDLIIAFVSRLDIVDETQLLIHRNSGSLEIDLLQNENVYLGRIESQSMAYLFGADSIVLKDVIKIPEDDARETSPTQKQIMVNLRMQELVVPIREISNVNLRPKLTKKGLWSAIQNA